MRFYLWILHSRRIRFYELRFGFCKMQFIDILVRKTLKKIAKVQYKCAFLKKPSAK